MRCLGDHQLQLSDEPEKQGCRGHPLWLCRKQMLPERVRQPVPGPAGILSNAEEPSAHEK